MFMTPGTKNEIVEAENIDTPSRSHNVPFVYVNVELSCAVSWRVGSVHWCHHLCLSVCREPALCLRASCIFAHQSNTYFCHFSAWYDLYRKTSTLNQWFWYVWFSCQIISRLLVLLILLPDYLKAFDTVHTLNAIRWPRAPGRGVASYLSTRSIKARK